MCEFIQVFIAVLSLRLCILPGYPFADCIMELLVSSNHFGSGFAKQQTSSEENTATLTHGYLN